MKKHTKNVTAADTKKVQSLVRKCIRLLSHPDYMLNLPATATEKALEVLTVKRNPRGTPSCAGAHSIEINLEYWQMGRRVHTEYDSFAKNRVIGDIEVVDNDDHLMIMIAHEVAHHVQMRYCYRVPRFYETYRKPHGECFRQVYWYLREGLVNPAIAKKKKALAA